MSGDADTLSRFDGLQRRIRFTAGARFNAARRLGLHDELTQWSVALASVALVIVPLLQALQVTTGLSPQGMSVLQVALAIFVLVFSLLLSRDKAAVRSDKMHRCALELNRLLRDIESLELKDGGDAFYQHSVDRYDSILRQYDNHETVDYETFLINHREEFYKDRLWNYLFHWLKARLGLLFQFLPYWFLITIILSSLVLMLRGAH